MASEEIVIPPDQAKTPPVLPKTGTPQSVLENPERSSSPEENCSICLNEFENKSFTDGCFHKFCFVCILEWSKVKAVCPLCKTSFKSIIHNIKSNEIYDQYHLQQNTPATDDQDGRRFRYRTTLTDDHRYAWELRQSNAFMRITREERRRYNEQRVQNQRNAAYNFRRYIYAIGVRVKQTRWNRFSGYRDISLDFFRRNPATVYRLVPWMQRDLSVIFNGDQNNVMFVTELILSLIQRIDIQTQEFKNNLQGFLLNKTEHFVHEFINFAHSPYDVQTYDQIAQYDYGDLSRLSEPPVNINEPLLVISSDSDSDIDIILPSPIDLSAHSREGSHNPVPPVESEINIAPGPSGTTSSIIQNSLVKQEKNTIKIDDNTNVEVTKDPSDSDVEIIGFLKPYHERTPELVVLSSGTEEEQPTCRKCGQPKHSSKCKKIKRKPKTAKSTSSHHSYRRSSSPDDYHRSSRSRSRSRYTRGKHDRDSRSSSREIEPYSRYRSRSINRTSSKVLFRSRYNQYRSTSSSANYSSDTDGYFKRYDELSNYPKERSQSHRSFGKSKKSTIRPYKYDRRSEKPLSRSHKPQSRYRRSRSTSVRSRTRRSLSRSRSRSYSRSHSRSHSRSDSRPYRSPIRSFRSRSRSHSRSKSRSHKSHSFSKSQSYDRELSQLHGHGKSHLRYWSCSSDGKNSNVSDKYNKKRSSRRKNSPNSWCSRSSPISNAQKNIDSSERSIEKVTAKTISDNPKKKRSKEKEERRKRREKRRLERLKKSGDPKDVIVIDLTVSADEKAGSRDVEEVINQDLLFEEEVSTMNQSENDTALAVTSGVGPMRALLFDDIAQASGVESLARSVNVEDGLLARTENQPHEPVRKTAFDLLIEAEKIRLQEMLNEKNDVKF
ncbi:E3 ubiquitin-protein ligase Topors-like [Anneissia japonica]|uniref:E3 ubiquitin-protein ligase Topors-like n=1 Tax=Anneissia japonica TaxID=1529436 RepID=UPI001425711B|nr:E3 ubiquitin-protein ligase Topors-like [Anneissia japonica]